MDPHLTHVKLYPEIALAALRNRQDREARLWHLARAIDCDGSGWLAVTDLQQALDDIATLDGLSPSTVRRLLQAGDGTFWQICEATGERYVRLRGIEAVALALGIERLGQPVWVPLEHVQRLKSWRGAILGAFHVSRTGSRQWSAPISRAKLEELTGYNGRCQRNWEKELGNDLKTRPNAWLHKERLADLPTRQELKELNNNGLFLEKIGNQVVILAFLPSSYWCAFALAPRGQTRKANRVLRPSGHVGATQYVRLFYCEPRALAKRTQGLHDGERAFGLTANVGGKDVTTSRGGWHLWTRYSQLEGQRCYR